MLMVLHKTAKGPRVAIYRDVDPTLAGELCANAIRAYWRDAETTREEMRMSGLGIGGSGYPGRLTLFAIGAKRNAASYCRQQEEHWKNHADTCRSYRRDVLRDLGCYGMRVFAHCMAISNRALRHGR